MGLKMLQLMVNADLLTRAEKELSKDEIRLSVEAALTAALDYQSWVMEVHKHAVHS